MNCGHGGGICLRKDNGMKLLLVRHGETDWNIKSRIQGRTDISLNGTGERQAEELGNMILWKKIPVAGIYTSKLNRARQTASIISEMLDVPCQVEEGLEEMNLGIWEGRTWKLVQEEYSREYQNWQDNRRYTRVPGGESYQDLLDRLLPALARILNKSRGDTLVVTHSACIMTLMSYLYEMPFEKMRENFRIGNAQICEVEEQSIRRVMSVDYTG